jgi:hypothetical protein
VGEEASRCVIYDHIARVGGAYGPRPYHVARLVAGYRDVHSRARRHDYLVRAGVLHHVCSRFVLVAAYRGDVHLLRR